MTSINDRISVLCPICFEYASNSVLNTSVRHEMICRKCKFRWTERSQELKRHKNNRLGRLEKVEEAVMQRRYEKLDEKFNNGLISCQEYSKMLKNLEIQNQQIHATLNSVWSKRLL